MQRLSNLSYLLSNKLSSPVPTKNLSETSLNVTDFYTDEQKKLSLKIREFLKENFSEEIMNCSYDKAEFPPIIIEKFKNLNLFEPFLKPPYGQGLSFSSLAFAIMELAKFDASIATFFWLQMVVNMHTVEALSSEEQKKIYLPKMANLDLISGWALTEPDIGSDASSLETSATPTKDGFVINGKKRWIGNANKNFNIVWARNTVNKKVEAFIVENNREGVSHEIIKHKLALRIVQNCDLTFKNVLIPNQNKIIGAKNFAATTQMLTNSRAFVVWIAVGQAFAVFDKCIEYAKERKQFGVPIASFQLVQEKLSRMAGNINAMFLLSWRILNLYEKKQHTLGQISMCKAWVTLKGREVVALGREILGGNGILIDNFIMKAFCDMEVLYTYEGSYDVNILIVGRDLTNINAFKN